jgi:uncharacterized protein YacL
MKRGLQFIIAAIAGAIAYKASVEANGSLFTWLGVNGLSGEAYWVSAVSAVTVYFASSWAAEQGMRWMRRGEEIIHKIPLLDLFAGTTGLIVGLLISVLVFPSMAKISGAGTLFPVILTMVLGYVGYRIGYKKKDEWNAVVSSIGIVKGSGKNGWKEEHKILDTSVIIDGRIADICKTGFIEGILVIPEFVLEELQHIADSSDLLKRNRGRRGLDILNKIQKELDVKVLIYEGDFEDISEVDSKLVRLAKVLEGKVVTNDFNLNKVCELQGVSVLNINDLANAVKPVVLPGEEILVQVIKDGKEHGQGVAYLDDGTMIVVEGGRNFIGSMLEVLVTSVLQTSAGRMIFAKPKLLEKAL